MSREECLNSVFEKKNIAVVDFESRTLGEMASDDSLPTLKILLIGPSGAGKSACEFCLLPPCFRLFARWNFGLMMMGSVLPTPGNAVLTRYCDDEFDPESSTATIGIDFKASTLCDVLLCILVVDEANDI